jgi:DNA excision repair protein ERCC-6
MKADVKKHIRLPEKSEQVLFCRLTEEQRALYRAYLDSRYVLIAVSGGGRIICRRKINLFGRAHV